MIKFSRHILDNGLTLLCSYDAGTPFVSVNILYKVGSKNENADKTGFAHLFEHLMFGGSLNIPDFDREIQLAGGDSNAYTTNDYTNYYITVPAANIETALWLESDRMLNLNFSPQSLHVQQQVVMEEYKQRYLNAPYGDIWLRLRPLAYKVHPYRWPTIGMSLGHIEQATLEDVKDFFNKYYTPDNAIISICGNITEDKAVALVKKWFGDIPPAHYRKPLLPAEPEQQEARRLVLENNPVPADMIWKVYHMGNRLSENFYHCDIISDILSNGQSSRLYLHLIKNSGIFSDVDAYVSGDTDPGLFIFSGKLSEGVSVEEAEKAMESELEHFISDPISERELQKIIHKTEARICYSEISYQTKAGNLAFFEFLGDAGLINCENKKYEGITVDKLKNTARELFRPENSSTLIYRKK
ncbi:M16 family metallopeptidase [Culturomica massiliensis]|uniref:M16 family metallopeptidase n=1 Tax=Culturomica massiliensis TaxID=1841857 RepID=UPI002670A01F|nr:pitrilysin family protein [Culturomica massiliensis]